MGGLVTAVIPSPLAFAILALAALRCWRLASRDTLPPLVRFRSWLVGSHTYRGKGVIFDRPLLAEWLQCAWCSGLWWSVGWWVFWLEQPRWAVYAAAPLALSAAAGALVSWLPHE